MFLLATDRRNELMPDGVLYLVAVGLNVEDTDLKYEVRASVIIHSTYVYIPVVKKSAHSVLHATYLCIKKSFRRVFVTLTAAQLGELNQGP